MFTMKTIQFILFINVNLLSGGTNIRIDPYKVTGDWYVVAVVTLRNDFPKFRCWTVHILEMNPTFYVGISHFSETAIGEQKLAVFKATVLDEYSTFVRFNVSVIYGKAVFDFEIYHMLSRPELLALSMVSNETKFFDFLIMSPNPILTENEEEMLRAEIHIDNTECPSNQLAQMANIIENFDILSSLSPRT